MLTLKKHPKNSQKRGEKRLVVILILQVLLVLTVTLLGCEKNDIMETRTIAIMANSSVAATTLSGTLEAEFEIDTLNRCKIVGLQLTTGVQSFGDNSMSVKGIYAKLVIPSRFLSPSSNSISVGAPNIETLILPIDTLIECQIEIPANLLLVLVVRYDLVAVGTDDLLFDSSLLITYQPL